MKDCLFKNNFFINQHKYYYSFLACRSIKKYHYYYKISQFLLHATNWVLGFFNEEKKYTNTQLYILLYKLFLFKYLTSIFQQ
jgi:hypothetical protein